MKRSVLTVLAMLTFLTACSTVEAPLASADPTQATALPPVPVVSDETTTVNTTSTPEIADGTMLPSGSKQISWEGITIPLPPDHVWQPDNPPPNPDVTAPVLAYGRIVFDSTKAVTDAVEQPEGISLTIVQFTGSLDEWMSIAQKAASAHNPIDTRTITQTTVAGHPTITYSYTVTGVSNSQSSVLKLRDDRVLIIENSNVDNPDYQGLLRMFRFTNP